MEIVYLNKMYGDHDIEIEVHAGGDLGGIARCYTCVEHLWIKSLDIDDENIMMFVDAELQLHGSNHGHKWELGLASDSRV